ncbi:hypothetical protein Tco_1410783 [Tanacetum coccineum]
MYPRNVLAKSQDNARIMRRTLVNSLFDNQSIERDRLIGIGFVLDFMEFISFTFGDKEMISVIEAFSCPNSLVCKLIRIRTVLKFDFLRSTCACEWLLGIMRFVLVVCEAFVGIFWKAKQRAGVTFLPSVMRCDFAYFVGKILGVERREDEGLTAGVEGPSMDDEGYGLDDECNGRDDESRGIDEEGYSVESDELGLKEREEVGGLISDHAVRLEELSTALFERYDRDIGELFTRSGAVREEIFSQRYRFRSLEYEKERVAVTFGAIWRPVLALEAWLAEERRARLELAEVVDGTEKSKIARKQSKTSKHEHENQKSSKRSQRIKAEARKAKPQSNPVKNGQ